MVRHDDCFRTIFAAARDNNLPEVLSYIHVEQRTPLVSMVFTVSSLSLVASFRYLKQISLIHITPFGADDVFVTVIL